MKPVIVHPEGVPEDAYLIDLHSVMLHDHPKAAEKGMLGQIALKAIAIKHLRAGQLERIDGRIYPCPTQLKAWAAMPTKPPMWRGIFPDAASALLSMPLLDFEMNAKRQVKLAIASAHWDEWRFLTAWGWSEWQALHRQGDKWTLERRWEALRVIGYPHGAAAFRRMCSDLKLSVTKSSPNP